MLAATLYHSTKPPKSETGVAIPACVARCNKSRIIVRQRNGTMGGEYLAVRQISKASGSTLEEVWFSIEHIVPRSKGGSNVEENLAFSCQGCNGHKHTATQAIDPINGDRTPLYNPRIHEWHEHFTWDRNFSVILGKTAIGRATVERLRLNRLGVVNLRQVLRQLDRHPP